MVFLHSSRGPVAIWMKEPAFLATSCFPLQTIKGDSSKVTVCFQPAIRNKTLFKLSFLVQSKSITCNRRRLSRRFSNYGPGSSTSNSILWAMQTHLSLDMQTPLVRYANSHLTRYANSVTPDLVNQESLWLKPSSLWSTESCR